MHPAFTKALLLGLAALLILSGCAGRDLMPTPNVYLSGQKELYGPLDESLKNNKIELVYVTDRVPEQDSEGRLDYGYGRSKSAAFGVATIEIGENLSWDEVLHDSLTRDRHNPLPLSITSIEEKARTPGSPIPFEVKDGKIWYDADVLAEAWAAFEKLGEELRERLARTPRKELFIFVHGYNNTFEDAAETLAELWHFMGREGVPLLYTWPAGHGGLSGYAYDRESGEFTIHHLKMLLTGLATIPEIEQINILAHSRGTDVATAALRELFIASRAAGRDPLTEFRISNLVLAAPDLDLQVVQQRLAAEAFGQGVGHITIYTSAEDKAIRISAWLFDSLRRIGTVQAADLTPEAMAFLDESARTDFVNNRGKTGFIGHGYWHSNPAVSSDLVMVLRFDAPPGAEHGRPLGNAGSPHFWYVDDSYMRPGADSAPQ